MDDLLHRTLLDCVCRGNALIAEISRLGECVPLLATLQLENDPEAASMFTFDAYFADPERAEARLNRVPAAVDADERFTSIHGVYLERFYGACLGLFMLSKDINRLIRDVRKGAFLSHGTLEQVLADDVGKQLLPEALHVLGASLLLLDAKVPGVARERLIVAYFRANKGDTLCLDDVVDLVRERAATDVPSEPLRRAESLLRRLRVDPKAARAVVTRLQAEDVYGHTHAWPEHRGTALMTQAAILYVVLLFAEATLPVAPPTGQAVSSASWLSSTTTSASGVNQPILSRGKTEMRELVDKHFSDSWIVCVCVGLWVDLEAAWAVYPAAKAALAETLSRGEEFASENASTTILAMQNLEEYLTRRAGALVLTDRFVTERWQDVLSLLRSANAALRWRMLHGMSKRFADPTLSGGPRKSSRAPVFTAVLVDPRIVVDLLLATAQLERLFKESVKRVLATKKETWQSASQRVSERMRELAQYFSGDVPLARGVKRDEEMMAWLNELAQQVDSLTADSGSPTATARKVSELIQALEEVERFDGIESSLQVREFLSDSRALLERMLGAVSVRDELVATIDVVSDLSYVFGDCLDSYNDHLKDRLFGDPRKTSLIEALLMKTSSVLDATLARVVGNASSNFVESVASYWSKKVQVYATRVLTYVSSRVFEILRLNLSVSLANLNGLLVGLQQDTDAASARVPASQLGTLAAGEGRYELARAIHGLTLYLDAIGAMRAVLIIGVERVVPVEAFRKGLQQSLIEHLERVLSRPLRDEQEDWLTETTRLYGAWLHVQDLCFFQSSSREHHARLWDDALRQVLCAKSCGFFESWIQRPDLPERLFRVPDASGFGQVAAAALRRALSAEMRRLMTQEFAVASTSTPSLLKLAEEWSRIHVQSLSPAAGEEEAEAEYDAVDAVRIARKGYGQHLLDRHVKLLHRLGTLEAQRRRLVCRYELAPEEEDDEESRGEASDFDEGSVEELKLRVTRLFVLTSELSKRLANESFSKTTSPSETRARVELCVLGLRRAASTELERTALMSMLRLNGRALMRRAWREARTAEASLFRGFGADKVAKVALNRLAHQLALMKTFERWSEVSGAREDQSWDDFVGTSAYVLL